MANTYTQIHIQAVFVVQGRNCIIKKSWKDELYRYIVGIMQNNGHKVLAINGMPDHIHVFLGLRPSQSLSDLMQDVKGSSSRWINEKDLSQVISLGRKVMGLSLIANRMLIRLSTILRIRKFIIERNHLWKNILSFWRNLRFHMTNVIFLNLWNIPKYRLCC